MPTYTVRREIEAVGTAHAASDSVAKSTATDEVREQLTAAGAETVTDLDVEATDVFEFPSGPFDPHRVNIAISLSVAVEAADEATAIEAGDDAIEELLAATELDDVEYVGSAHLDAPAN